jgi:putative ATP-dependent endonuclease of OLD family
MLDGGDVGKTTIADAIGLLLSPVNSSNLADTDYFCRKIEDHTYNRFVRPGKK